MRDLDLMPAILRKILTALGVTFKPDGKRPEYEAALPRYQLYADLMEMDQDKLLRLVDQHEGESTTKFDLRKKLACVFNYVPTVIGMNINYVFSEDPKIESTHAGLTRFIANCNGSGLPLAEYVRHAAPLGLLYGYIDTLVQNPDVNPLAVVTQADAAAEGLLPRVYTITPQQRLDWASRQSHDYNWLRFVDVADESENPFRSIDTAGPSVRYITISAAIKGLSEGGSETGFFVVSKLGNVDKRTGREIKPPLDPVARLTVPAVKADQGWIHDGRFMPMPVVPIQTLYYKQSHDPYRRHEGLSKVATIATLTRKIIQVLSWTDEDTLANLAIYVFPGDPPKDKKDPTKNAQIVFSPFSVFHKGKGNTGDAQMLQGDTAILDFKIKLIDTYIREILRVAFMLGASAEAEKITSGIQGVVARNELLMECKDTAKALDDFVMGILAHAASWIDNKFVTKEEVRKVCTVNFFKGPYITEPVEILIENTTKLVALFTDLSPEMVKWLFKQLAIATISNEDSVRQKILKEIDSRFDDVMAQREQERAEMQAAVDAAAAAESGAGDDGSGINTPPTQPGSRE